MKTLNARRAFLSRSWVPGALICLLFQLSAINASAGVIYQYVETGSGVVLGTLDVDSPATTSAGWSTADTADLLGLFLNPALGFGSGNLVVGSTVSFSAGSLTGATLDAGGIGLTLPAIPGDPTIFRALSLSFALPPGADTGAAAVTFTFSNGMVLITDHFVEGNWVAQQQIPEPGTLALFALALLARRWRHGRQGPTRT